MNMALILLGAAIGGPLRFVVDQQIRRYTTKPYGIFTVNILGSFLLGLTYGRAEQGFDLFAIRCLPCIRVKTVQRGSGKPNYVLRNRLVCCVDRFAVSLISF